MGGKYSELLYSKETKINSGLPSDRPVGSNADFFFYLQSPDTKYLLVKHCMVYRHVSTARTKDKGPRMECPGPSVADAAWRT